MLKTQSTNTARKSASGLGQGAYAVTKQYRDTPRTKQNKRGVVYGKVPGMKGGIAKPPLHPNPKNWLSTARGRKQYSL